MADHSTNRPPDPLDGLRRWWTAFPMKIRIGIIVTAGLMLFPLLQGQFQ